MYYTRKRPSLDYRKMTDFLLWFASKQTQLLPANIVFRSASHRLRFGDTSSQQQQQQNAFTPGRVRDELTTRFNASKRRWRGNSRCFHNVYETKSTACTRSPCKLLQLMDEGGECKVVSRRLKWAETHLWHMQNSSISFCSHYNRHKKGKWSLRPPRDAEQRRRRS